MSQDPNQPPSEYGTPQNPYGEPQPPYGGPQNPYGNVQNPYQNQSPYAPGNNPNPGGYYNGPEATPLPLGQALQQLPHQYIKITTKPSVLSFVQEQGKAAWDIVWVQLVIYAVIAAILGYVSSLYTPLMGTLNSQQSASLQGYVGLLTAGSSIGSIVSVPLAFFISQGIYFLFAKLFKGQGSFLVQCYNALLYTVPLGILISVVRLIPIPLITYLVTLAIGIYEIVLTIFGIQAAHRLSGGKATATVLLPVAILFLLACGLVFLIIIAVAGAIHNANP